MPKLDLINHTYGRLTVVEEDGHIGKERAFICRCDCKNPPNYIRVSMASLRSGNTKSCGCLPVGRPRGRKRKGTIISDKQKSKYDLTDRTFGHLTVIKKVGSRNRIAVWLCRCKCGEMVERTTTYLKGPNPSCGCADKKRGAKPGKRTIPKKRVRTSRGTGVRGVTSRVTDGTVRYLATFSRKGKVYTGPYRKTIEEAVEDRKRLEIERRLSGDRYGELEVIRLSDRTTSNNTRLWECKCHACGAITYVLATALRAGHYKSCGCLQPIKRDSGLARHIESDRVDGTRKSALIAKLHRNNKSGVKGVCWLEDRQTWKAYIGIGGKNISLGYRKNKEDAIALRKAAEEKYHKPYLEARHDDNDKTD